MKNTASLSIHSGLVVRSPFDASLVGLYQAEHGPVDITWTPTTVLMKHIENGLRCDLVIVTDQAMDTLIDQGIVDIRSRRPLIVSGIGFAVKQGAPKPDISSPEKLKAALLAARSICYSIGGASGIHFKTVLAGLGIEKEVTAKACPIPEGFTAEKLITGEADLAVQQISELLVVSGIDIVGPLPGDLQKSTSFAIAQFSQSDKKQAGAVFIDIVTSPDAKAEYQRFGLECRF